MASQWRQVQTSLQQEKLDISRFVSEGGHDLDDARNVARRESTFLRGEHHHSRRAHISLTLDEDVLDAIRQDAEFQGKSPQELIRWLLSQYAAGALTPKHYPWI